MIILSAFPLEEQQNNFRRWHDAEQNFRRGEQGAKSRNEQDNYIAIAVCHNQNEEAHFTLTSQIISFFCDGREGVLWLIEDFRQMQCKNTVSHTKDRVRQNVTFVSLCKHVILDDVFIL